MAEIGAGTLYEWNKAALNNEPKLKETKYKDLLRKIRETLKEATEKHYMLLCNELRDYTIFEIKTENIQINEIRETLDNRGFVVSIEKRETNDFEIWIKNEEGIFVYYLFPCDAFFVEV